MKVAYILTTALGLIGSGLACEQPGTPCDKRLVGARACQCNAGILLECINLGTEANKNKRWQKLKDCPDGSAIKCANGKCQ
ncbi:hypothetical protein CAC42_3192 [Sphaceloma murrayae]|uniref:Uncharacterized protein n=1 Tax=Sphaceloma murrayae TaxID=2082308 RepID=A0A2K1QRT4_9PEZI|nr:hypothetical protein CAC42_3192 [Sphaceloma murrayae]